MQILKIWGNEKRFILRSIVLWTRDKAQKSDNPVKNGCLPYVIEIIYAHTPQVQNNMWISDRRGSESKFLNNISGSPSFLTRERINIVSLKAQITL